MQLETLTKDRTFYNSVSLELQDKALLEWSQKYGLDEQVRWLFDVLRLNELDTDCLIVVLELLKSEKVQILLRSWSDSTYALKLMDLGKHACKLIDTELFFVPAKDDKLFKGKKRRVFLQLFLMSKADIQFLKLREYSYIFKTWLLVKAIEALDVRGIALEKNVADLSRFFSFDSTNQKARMALTEKIVTDIESNALSLELQTFSWRLSQAFSRVFHASNLTERENRLSQFESLASFRFEPFSESVSQGQDLWLLSSKKNHQDKSYTNQWIYSKAENSDIDICDDRDVAVTRVDKNILHEYQVLSSKSILFTSAERSCYLPWSIFKPTPPEIEKLLDWVGKPHLEKVELSHEGKALIYIAISLGRPPSRVENLKVGESAGKEWSLSPTSFVLQRYRPENGSEWRCPSTLALPVQKLSEFQRIELPNCVQNGLRKLLNGDSITYLGDAWRRKSGMSLDEWFRKAVSEEKGLSRVQPSMLEYIAEQRVYSQTHSNATSRLLSFHPQQKLPSLCSYHTWRADEILELDLGYQHLDWIKGILIAGSEQNLSEEIVQRHFRLAAKKIEALDTDDICHYHNQYCLYVLSALVAATGIRAIRDPFENLDHFNFSKSIVYLNDKSDGLQRDGRLVLLPNLAINILKNYLEHLKSLSNLLNKVNTDLSRSIYELTLSQGQRKLPLFFLLDSKNGFEHIESRHYSFDGALSWEMQANFFRHRIVKKLFSYNVPEEFVEGHVGHADLGISSYGYSSVRCPKQDFKMYAQAINKSFSDLNITLVKSKLSGLKKISQINIQYTNEEKRIFGIEARRKERIKNNKVVQENARITIDDFLERHGINKISELNQAEYESLQKQLLKSPSGKPHPRAGFRFRYLVKRVNFEGAKASHYLRLIQRVDAFPVEKSCFGNDTPNFIEIFESIRGQLEKLKKAGDSRLVQVTNLNNHDSLSLFCFLLLCESRVSSIEVLKRVINLRNIKLVFLSGCYFLELYDDAPPLNGRSSQRHKISFLAAKCLNKILSAKKKISQRNVQKFLVELVFDDRTILNKDSVSLEDFCRHLSEIVRAYNFYDLPGILAGSLDSAPAPTSLPWSEWALLTIGKSLSLEGGVESIDSDLVRRVIKHTDLVLDGSHKQINAYELIERFSDEISFYEQKQVGRTVEKLKALLRNAKTQISSSAYMFFSWYIQVVEKGKRSSARLKRIRPYAKKSIETLLSLVAKPYVSFLGEKEINLLEKDSFNAILANLVDSREGKEKSQWQFLFYLKTFLQWAEKHYSLPEVDWILLDQELDFRPVSAGLVFEDEYLRAIDLALKETSSDNSLQLAGLLFFCYRFGLRFSEAAYLRRSDIYGKGNELYIVVKDYAFRHLKRTSSNRVVPLLFELTEKEHHLFEKLIAEFDARSDANMNQPLIFSFMDVADRSIQLGKLSSKMKSILVQSTGRYYISPNHLRHSFYNIIAIALLIPDDFPLHRLATISSSKIRQKLMGNEKYKGVRDSRAIARLLGHGSVATGLRSYCHVMTLWSDTLIDDYSSKAKILDCAINLSEKFSSVKNSKKELSSKQELQSLDLTRIFQFLSLYSQGNSMSSIVNSFAICPDQVVTLVSSLTEVSFKLFPEFEKEKAFRKLLNKIKPADWGRLISFAEQLEVSTVEIEIDIEVGDLSSHISNRAHWFARNITQLKFFVQILQWLNVEPNEIKIYRKGVDEKMWEVLGKYQLSIDNKVRHDPISFVNERGGLENPKDCYAFVLQRNSRVARNGFIFSIVISAIALVNNLQRA